MKAEKIHTSSSTVTSVTWGQLYPQARLLWMQEQLIVSQGSDADVQLTPRDRDGEALCDGK